MPAAMGDKTISNNDNSNCLRGAGIRDEINVTEALNIVKALVGSVGIVARVHVAAPRATLNFSEDYRFSTICIAVQQCSNA